ncbi:hypothetical protein [Sphingomonas montanisoli]|uniref:Uncharacterized protein n=1 Tax=Sphingomonas montanisoli TaxID=2606412 RepID=A0A5D9C167_9SPHN|nr:hypothetical protein [Sphingomonas montanisoli]TZG25598.1 hypothetical protein FYJ91_11265 [Sphingomonas montanisoli]
MPTEGVNISTLIRSMAAAGATPEAIALAVEAIESVQALIDAKRAAARDKKRRQRAAANDQQGHGEDIPGTVPGQAGDMGGTVPDSLPLSPPSPKDPQTPKEPQPPLTPTCGVALTRKAAGFGPPDGVGIGSWNTFCQQRKKALTRIAYDRIVKTLAEGAEAGWPPGELVDRAIERTWETIFVPKDRRNGHHRPANDHQARETYRDPLLQRMFEDG